MGSDSAHKDVILVSSRFIVHQPHWRVAGLYYRDGAGPGGAVQAVRFSSHSFRATALLRVSS
jgi:hypothetical protein